MDNSWYQQVSKDRPIAQGDFLDRFPILQLKDAFFENQALAIKDLLVGSVIGTKLQFTDVVVLTQSCDMDTKDTNRKEKPDPTMPVVLCPRADASEAKFDGKAIDINKWENLRKNRSEDVLLLKKCDITGYEFDYQIVDFSHIFTMPLFFVEKFISEMEKARITLTSPYKEYLAQGFARKFSRVALPEIITKEEYPYT